jgi:DNA (cytosine-5)-methyltransferase 1
MSFNYKWKFSDYPEKNGLKVFSTFACGGGSTMGYKLAGFEVIGANDIDIRMEKLYKKNHNPKYFFRCDIRKLAKQTLPKEFFEIDVLDGSPPCTSFSTAGNREKDWQKNKKYAEGQAYQTLDDLFFRFLEFANYIKPKVIITENVKGLIIGNAKKYYINIQ